MITKFKIYENINNLDPYGEEVWDDENDNDNPANWNIGDTVICIDAGDNENLLNGEEYEIHDKLTDGFMLILRGNPTYYLSKRFKLKTKLDEHIAYLDDDGFDYDPEELLDVVGLPSGEYFQIRRKNYSRVQRWVNWSEKWQSYVYIDRFLPTILENLPLDDFHPYTKNG